MDKKKFIILFIIAIFIAIPINSFGIIVRNIETMEIDYELNIDCNNTNYELYLPLPNNIKNVQSLK